LTDVLSDNDSKGLGSDDPQGGAPAGMGDVRADRVELSQGGAASITANTVTVSQGGAGRVRATDMSVTQGGVGVARVDRLTLNGQSGALAVVASEASMTGEAKTFLLVAGRTNGPVSAAVDVRAAAAFGAAFALVVVVLRRLL
jgi:hypothetical protein